MKKKTIFLIIFIMLLCGCSIYQINNLSYDEIINNITLEPNFKTNTALRGYKLYLPQGMTLVGDHGSNNIIYSNKERYYLYVDLISFYKKTKNDYKINETNAFYKKVLINDGYILVSNLRDKYLLEVMWNNAKIEVITTNVNEALSKSLIILKSIEFNKKVIESLIGNNVLNYKEVELNLLGPVTNNSDILHYEGYTEEYGQYQDIDNELPDEDKLDLIVNE